MLKTECEIKVRFGETDAAGIVYYPNFYKWMDLATHEMLEKAGYTVRQMLNEKKGLPLIETHCRFRSPLFVGDRIKVISVIAELRNKAFRIEHTFYRGEELIAEGYEVHAWVENAGGALTPQPLPDFLRKPLSGESI